MTGHASIYRASVAGGLRVAAGPRALVAANVAAFATRGYRVWVRDPDGRVVAIQLDHDQHHLTYQPGPDTASEHPPWVDRLSALLAELSNTTTNQERSSTP